MMRAWIAAVAALAAGCAVAPEEPQVDPLAATRDPSCYTVDLFSTVSINEPSDDVPERWRAFSGRWGGGKWGGEWCHDLYVLDIQPDGQVRVIETYAPLEKWGKRATAFSKVATIGSDGRLRLRSDGADVEYWIEDGELRGTRTEIGGTYVIAMERRSA